MWMQCLRAHIQYSTVGIGSKVKVVLTLRCTVFEAYLSELLYDGSPQDTWQKTFRDSKDVVCISLSFLI